MKKLLKYRFGIVLTLLIIALIYIAISSVAIITYSKDCEKTRSELNKSEKSFNQCLTGADDTLSLLEVTNQLMLLLDEEVQSMDSINNALLDFDYYGASYYIGEMWKVDEKVKEKSEEYYQLSEEISRKYQDLETLSN